MYLRMRTAGGLQWMRCWTLDFVNTVLVKGKLSRRLHYTFYDALYIFLSSLQTCSRSIFPANFLILPTPVVLASCANWTTLCYTNFIITFFAITLAANQIFNSPFLSIGRLVFRNILVSITTWLMAGESSSTLVWTRQFPFCASAVLQGPTQIAIWDFGIKGTEEEKKGQDAPHA
jgi:hypothetical protein